MKLTLTNGRWTGSGSSAIRSIGRLNAVDLDSLKWLAYGEPLSGYATEDHSTVIFAQWQEEYAHYWFELCFRDPRLECTYQSLDSTPWLRIDRTDHKGEQLKQMVVDEVEHAWPAVLDDWLGILRSAPNLIACLGHDGEAFDILHSCLRNEPAESIKACLAYHDRRFAYLKKKSGPNGTDSGPRALP